MTNIPALRRRTVSPWSLSLLVALYLLVLCNHALWREFVEAFAASGGIGNHVGLAIAVLLRLLGSLALTLTLISWPKAGKPLLAMLIVIAAASAYYIDNYGVRLNEDVLQSIFETSRAEASAMVTGASVMHILLFGLLPALLVLAVPLRFAPWPRLLLWRVAGLAGIALMMLVPPVLAGRDYVYFNRNHRTMYEVFNPYAALSGSFHHLQRNVFHREPTLRPIGTDARLVKDTATAPRRRLVVLAVGETARAQDQSLGGYGRDTNPAMRSAGAIYFTDAWSCGTATTVSVPCMFSAMPRASFDKPTAMSQWNLLDILQHAGVAVQWLDNDEGCKGVCARVANLDLTRATVPGLCGSDGCLDQVLLQDLPQRLARLRSPALLVLHLKGSHGPAYFQRYPDAFRRFTPACETAEVQTCSYAQTVNSYDNTILYTDHILGEVMKVLQAERDVDSALFYLSDHGESLGEGGIYLHGMDWDDAPSQQKHIPMLLWFSPGWRHDRGLDLACLDRRRVRPASQDNLFHTVLGLFDVRTTLYQPALDLLTGCR